MSNFDPNAMFMQMLANETGEGAAKTASDANATTSPFSADFFTKLANDDAAAMNELNEYTSARLSEGLTSDEVIAEVAGFEAEAMAAGAEGSGTADDGEGGEGSGTADDEDDFENAKVAAQVAGYERAVTDELANNQLAIELGITQEKLATFLLSQEEGAAYQSARTEVKGIIEKIASMVLPSEEQLEAAAGFLKQAGIDLSSIEEQAAEFSKQASAAEAGESVAVRMAREVAEQEANTIDALRVLQAAGFDVEKVAADAEGKKKMSGKAKAALGLGGAAATGAALYGASKTETGKAVMDEAGRRMRQARQSGGGIGTMLKKTFGKK